MFECLDAMATAEYVYIVRKVMYIARKVVYTLGTELCTLCGQFFCCAIPTRMTIILNIPLSPNGVIQLILHIDGTLPQTNIQECDLQYQLNRGPTHSDSSQ